MKVIESKLIKDRIATITDKQILMDQFTSVFQKSFRYSSITMYDEPVTRCSILISAEDMIEKKWIHDLKDLLTLSDDQVHIHFDNDENNKVEYPEENLCDISIQKYFQFFPCCVMLTIMEKVDEKTNEDNSSETTKHVIVLPSLQAKDHSLNKLNNYIEYIKQTSLYGDKDVGGYDRIKYEIGDIEEHCGSIGLDLYFNNTKSFENEIKNQRNYSVTMISGESNQPNINIDIDISYPQIFRSTLSGIVQCDEDFYLVTTGHGMSDKCIPINTSYECELTDRIWPSALELSDAKEFIESKCYGSTLSGGSIESFVSDVAILKLTGDIDQVFKCPLINADIISEYTKILRQKVPSLPNIDKLKEKVHYSGYMTQGEMEIVGSGAFCQKFNGHWIYERFYVAKHISSSLFDYCFSNETLPGDSGACVTTKDFAIHSFLIGKTSGNDQFRLLSPAHFVLEQIKTLTAKENVEFKKCEKKTSFLTSNFIQSFVSRPYKRIFHEIDDGGGNDVDVATQTTTVSDSHVMLNAPLTTASNVNSYDDDDNVATTDVAFTTKGFVYNSSNSDDDDNMDL